MKKFLFLAVAAVSFVACNSNKQAETAEVEEVPVEVIEDAAVAVDSISPDSAAVTVAEGEAVVAE